MRRNGGSNNAENYRPNYSWEEEITLVVNERLNEVTEYLTDIRKRKAADSDSPSPPVVSYEQCIAQLDEKMENLERAIATVSDRQDTHDDRLEAGKASIDAGINDIRSSACSCETQMSDFKALIDADLTNIRRSVSHCERQSETALHDLGEWLGMYTALRERVDSVTSQPPKMDLQHVITNVASTCKSGFAEVSNCLDRGPNKLPSQDNHVLRIGIAGGSSGSNDSATQCLRDALIAQSFDVYIVPDCLTLLIDGGVEFTQHDDKVGLVNSISSSLCLQLEMERSWLKVANSTTKPSVIIVQRAMFDISVKLERHDWQDLLNIMGLTDSDIFAHYDLVLHLGATAGSKLCEAQGCESLDVWTQHPRVYLLETEANFTKQVGQIVETVAKLTKHEHLQSDTRDGGTLLQQENPIEPAEVGRKGPHNSNGRSSRYVGERDFWKRSLHERLKLM